jgi:hypothetical protein
VFQPVNGGASGLVTTTCDAGAYMMATGRGQPLPTLHKPTNKETAIPMAVGTSPTSPTSPSPVGSSTAEVFARHLQAFWSGDVEAFLADYDSQVVLCLPDQTLHGLEGVRTFFAMVGRLFPPGQSQLEVLRQEVHGDCVYLAWRGSSAALDPSAGADTFVIRNGRIVFQSFGGQLNLKSV